MNEIFQTKKAWSFILRSNDNDNNLAFSKFSILPAGKHEFRDFPENLVQNLRV